MISSRWHPGEMREVLRGGHRLRFRAPARKEDHLPRFEACDLLRARDHDHLEETPMKQRQKLKDDICYIRILGKKMKDKYGEVNWYNWAHLKIWMNLMDFQELDCWECGKMWQYAALCTSVHCAFQENLLLNDKGHVKLTDMGLAKATETDRNRSFFPCFFCHFFCHNFLLCIDGTGLPRKDLHNLWHTSTLASHGISWPWPINLWWFSDVFGCFHFQICPFCPVLSSFKGWSSNVEVVWMRPRLAV